MLKDQKSDNYLKKLSFSECLQLLVQLIEKEFIKADSNNKDNILIYRKAGNNSPEGWYSENIFSVAQELANDYNSQQRLQKVLEAKGFEPKFSKSLKSIIERE